MGSGRQFNRLVLVLICLVMLACPVTYAGECTGVSPQYVGDPFCEGNCDPCGGGSGACCVEDVDLQVYCCADLAAVPELPTWFGPFFLATLVAGWEYWRIRRRRIVLKTIKRN